MFMRFFTAYGTQLVAGYYPVMPSLVAMLQSSTRDCAVRVGRQVG